MFLRSYNAAPYDGPAAVLPGFCGLALLGGCLASVHRVPMFATILGRTSVLVALIAVGFIYLVTATRGAFMGAGRLVIIWPSLVVGVALFVLWRFRADKL
jgi:hypothetical protein